MQQAVTAPARLIKGPTMMDEEWTFAEDSKPKDEPEPTFADEDFSFKEVEPELAFAEDETPAFRIDEET